MSSICFGGVSGGPGVETYTQETFRQNKVVVHKDAFRVQLDF